MENKPLKILFVGDLNSYGRTLQRFETLRNIGHFMTSISTVPVPQSAGTKPGFFSRILWKIGFPPDPTGANKKIKEAARKERFDILWIEKGLTIRPATLKFVRSISSGTKIVSCSEDDMYKSHNQSVFYVRGLKFYDVVFTTKVYNLEELKSLGAKRTELYLDSYDERIHRPVDLSEQDRKRFGADVGFVGAFEEFRIKMLLALAEHGIKVTVWGPNWGPWVGKDPNLNIKNEFLYRDDYARALNATKINLCFLMKKNRDEVTCRSMEIPGCGAFMLAERSRRHEELYKEGEEAAFFSDSEELYKAVQKYLADDNLRKKVAAGGRERSLKSGYSMRAQLNGMIERV